MDRTETKRRYNESLRNAEINAVQKSCSELERFRLDAERRIDALSELVQELIQSNEQLEERLNKAAKFIATLSKRIEELS